MAGLESCKEGKRMFFRIWKSVPCILSLSFFFLEHFEERRKNLLDNEDYGIHARCIFPCSGPTEIAASVEDLCPQHMHHLAQQRRSRC